MSIRQKPSAVMPFLDAFEILCERPLTRKLRRRFKVLGVKMWRIHKRRRHRRCCGGRESAAPTVRYQFLQPTPRALAILTRHEARERARGFSFRVVYCEAAIDFLFPSRRSARVFADHVDAAIVIPGVRLHDGRRIGETTYCRLNSDRRTDPLTGEESWVRRRGVNVAIYPDRTCKALRPSKQPCCHVELRITGSSACHRFGVGSVEELQALDIGQLFVKRLRFVRFRELKLGAYRLGRPRQKKPKPFSIAGRQILADDRLIGAEQIVRLADARSESGVVRARKIADRCRIETPPIPLHRVCENVAPGFHRLISDKLARLLPHSQTLRKTGGVGNVAEHQRGVKRSPRNARAARLGTRVGKER